MSLSCGPIAIGRVDLSSSSGVNAHGVAYAPNNSYAVAPFCDSSMGRRNHFLIELIETGAASTGSVGRIAGGERAGDEGFPA